MNKEDLYEEVIELINSKREGAYWDFKQCYHTSNAALVHDIICMANSRANRNCYLIFGVENNTAKILGIENDPKAKNQQQIIDMLKSKKFAGDIRPTIDLYSFDILKHKVDVLVIRNTLDTPYYLTADYKDGDKKQKIVRAYHIYTRIGDTNTDIDKSADINHVEYLWKKRFGLHLSPLERLKFFLAHNNEWNKESQTHYHCTHPEFTLTIEDNNDSGYREFYAYAMTNHTGSYYILLAKYFGTTLFTQQLVSLDSGRYLIPCPDWGFIHYGNHKQDSIPFKYYIKKSIEHILFNYFIDNDKSNYDMKGFYDVVLKFYSNEEKEKFVSYASQNIGRIKYTVECLKEKYLHIEIRDDCRKKDVQEKLRYGFALNCLLSEFRSL